MSTDPLILSELPELKQLITNLKIRLVEYCRSNLPLPYVSLDKVMTAEIQKIGAYYFPNLISEGSCASHYTSLLNETRVITGENSVTLDFGLIYKKRIPVDTAMTIVFTKTESESTLISVLCNVQRSIQTEVTPSWKIRRISQHIRNSIPSEYSISPELCGHSLSADTIHGNLQIPACPAPEEWGQTANMENFIQVGSFFTIEPFVSLSSEGNPYFEVREGQDDQTELFAQMTVEGYVKPQSLRRVLNKDIRFSGAEMDRMELYPPYYHTQGKPVFQFEDTYYMTETGPIMITTDYDSLEKCLRQTMVYGKNV
jgi:methionine aminopeptidase